MAALPNINPMNDKFPADEFAAAEPHGGRHRRIRTGRNRFGEFLKLTLISALLATLVLVGIKLADSVNLFNAEPSAPATIAILDGSKLSLSNTVASELVDAGYEVASSAEFVVDAAKPEAAQSVSLVYALDSSYLDKAKEVASLLGIDSVSINSQSTAPITVVVGTDLK